ncbi:MAG TPA: M1 family metallopeptidase [Bryobacteraceae bacterium]|jgi:aminopeptidase N|nr:M1 family metallopeptidase [Bryobacteraceae bacterium]
MEKMDIHSWSRPNLIRVRHLELDLDVRFDRRVLQGTATLHLERVSGDELVLDTRGLEIHAVDNAAGYALGTADAILGAPLRIAVLPGETWVRVHYSTSPLASGLQWLDAAQTAGKAHPFLYTQSQAIHARSWIPLQDTPSVRVTFDAEIRVPAGLRAVMGAEMAGNRFRMPQAIPSYLIALAVGDLAFHPLGERSGVYAEPSMVDAAAYEFADTEAMIGAVEAMYGPYRWGRYDLLVLPPSFPFGGMENPRLTFATTTVIAGDRSLVSLVAHELAHSWSGNLVTNATWSDFWLNEGFTVYVERRVLERLYGPDRAAMEAVLGRRQLDAEMAGLRPTDRVLHIDLTGRDPDDGCTLVPYEKGALLLRTIEQAVGRERFDAFLRGYFDRFAFQSITTADFLDYIRRELPNPVPLDEWIFDSGIPAGAAEPHSDAFERVEAGWPGDTAAWSTHQWLHFLRSQNPPDMPRLDRAFHFTESRNAEILFEWLLMAVKMGYQPAMGQVGPFLKSVGRRKFLKPLYGELMKTPAGQALARMIYAEARAGYHPIAQATIDSIVA